MRLNYLIEYNQNVGEVISYMYHYKQHDAISRAYVENKKIATWRFEVSHVAIDDLGDLVYGQMIYLAEVL